MSVDPYDVVLDHLDVPHRNGDNTAMARCPAHEDRNPSLSVTRGDDKVLLHCHAGCSVESILTAAGMSTSDLFATKMEPRFNTTRRIEAARYRYTDAEGTHLFDVVRTDPKGFHQEPASGKRGRGSMANVPMVLYRLPELIEVVAAGLTAYIGEGEKDADALTAAGYMATCNPMGAGKWAKVADQARQVLAGANVIIVADRDDAGYAHARDVARSLLSTAATITVVEAKIGKDAADHLGAGCSVEDFCVIASTAPASNERALADWLAAGDDEHEQEHEESSADYLRSRLMTTEQIRKLPPPTPLIAGYLYLDTLAVLYGSAGVGKSHTTIDMANTITSGRSHWFGQKVTTGGVLYVVAEGASGVGIRTESWETFHTVKSTVTWLPEAVNIYAPQWASALAEVVAERRPVLVVLDTFARSIVGADENSAKDVGQAIANLDLIRQAAGSCVLVVHHSGKDKSAGARGSTALKGALSTELEVVGTEGRLTLRNPKQKDAPEQPPVHLMLQPVPGTDSVVVVEAGGTASDELPTAAFDTLEAFREIDVPGGVSPATWQRAVEVAERTFYRHRAGLLQYGHIVNVGSDKQPKYRPAQAANTP